MNNEVKLLCVLSTYKVAGGVAGEAIAISTELLTILSPITFLADDLNL